MNSVKSQDTKLIHRNLSHCYTVKTKDQKIKKTFTTATTTTKIPRNKPQVSFNLFSFFFSCCFFLNFIYFLNIYLFGCAGHAGFSIFSCGIWDLVPWPGIKPRPPALGVQNLSHRTTREVLIFIFNFYWV